MAGSCSCPHEVDDHCTRVRNLRCDPGMKGCVLYGRFVFANEEKNQRLRRKQARRGGTTASPDPHASRDAED